MSGTELKLGGRRKSGASVKTLKKMLKKAGLKVSGKKATLTRRAKKAHLKMAGGADPTPAKASDSGMPTGSSSTPGTGATPAMGGRRPRSRGRSMRGYPRLF